MFQVTDYKVISIIERSAIDGQKVYHSDLEKAMRLYIQEHQSEFLPEGIEPIVIGLTQGLSEAVGVDGVQLDARLTDDEFKQRREKEFNEDCNGLGIHLREHHAKYSRALELVRDALGIKVQVRPFCGSLLFLCC